MAKMEVGENVVKITDMKLKGGKLPDDVEFTLTVFINYTGVDRQQLLKVASSGQSTRVALQSKLRTWPVAKLRALNGCLKIAFKDIYAVAEETPQDRLMRLDKNEFFEVMKAYGLNREETDAMYDRKHGTAPEPETEENEDEE